MNESVFREILGEALRREFAEFDDAPRHRFSLRHRLAMKRIFAKYERNARGFFETEDAAPRYGFKQRIIYALVIIILMTLLTGWFIPIRGIAEEQIDWLRARYDFPNMKMQTSMLSVSDLTSVGSSPYTALGFYRETDEYRCFLDDLVYLGIYSEEEMFKLENRVMPMDTRPDSFKNGYVLDEIPVCFGDESPLEYMREYVSIIESKIGFYTERSKDPSRAIEGDVEFAELIREKYWELNHGFLELLERLFAEKQDEQEDGNNPLSYFDKDDKRYLLEINKV